jgi:hypothetical protein
VASQLSTATGEWSALHGRRAAGRSSLAGVGGCDRRWGAWTADRSTMKVRSRRSSALYARGGRSSAGNVRPARTTERGRCQLPVAPRRPVRSTSESEASPAQRGPTAGAPRPARDDPLPTVGITDPPTPGMAPPGQHPQALRTRQPARSEPLLDRDQVGLYREHHTSERNHTALPHSPAKGHSGWAVAYPDPKIVTVAAPTKQVNATRSRQAHPHVQTAREHSRVVILEGGQHSAGDSNWLKTGAVPREAWRAGSTSTDRRAPLHFLRQTRQAGRPDPPTAGALPPVSRETFRHPGVNGQVAVPAAAPGRPARLYVSAPAGVGSGAPLRSAHPGEPRGFDARRCAAEHRLRVPRETSGTSGRSRHRDLRPVVQHAGAGRARYRPGPS